MPTLKFTTPAEEQITLTIDQVLLAGYAGREPADVEAHAAEMLKLSVPVPHRFPVFYRVMPCLLTQSGTVDVVGSDTYPEVEYVLFSWKGRRYVTVGNDQFDLVVERHGWWERSKNLCQKIVADMAWPLAEVSSHWDELVLELWANEQLLQRGSVKKLLKPEGLLDLAWRGEEIEEESNLLFSGTIATLQNAEVGSRQYCMKLRDPVLSREIVSHFKVFDISRPRSLHDDVTLP